MNLDWLEGTINLKKTKKTVLHTVSELQAYFSGLGLAWVGLDRGAMGYTHSAKVGDSIKVFWSPERSEMGVHVSIPSSGLAELGASASAIASDFRHMGFVASRLDIAGDDFEGCLNIGDMLGKFDRGEFVCRSHLVEERKSHAGRSGRTIYVGKRGSESFLRIYDKSAEQADKGKGVFTSWVRAEIELRGDRAQAAFLQIATNPEGWQSLALGWLRSYLDFKEVGEDGNKSRWDASPFWLTFLENALKIRLVVPRVPRTIEGLRNWIQKQVTPTLYALGQTIGYEKVFSDILAGGERLNSSLSAIVQAFELESELIGVAS